MDLDEKVDPPVCGLCHREIDEIDAIPCDIVRASTVQVIEARSPDWRDKGFICREDYHAARRDAIKAMLLEERGELTSLDQTVIESIARHEALTSNVTDEFDSTLSFADRLSDRIAAFGGSWTFILTFCAFLILWIALNVTYFLGKPFDPYPFILLNLALSFIAALQAPLIMMSQRRQEAKDRKRSENDYRVNLKAELEIRHLHEKMDHLMVHQWERQAEIQQAQLDLLDDILRTRGSGGSTASDRA